MKYFKLTHLLETDLQELKNLPNSGSDRCKRTQSVILEALSNAVGSKAVHGEEKNYYHEIRKSLKTFDTGPRSSNSITVFNLSMDELELLGRITVAFHLIYDELRSAEDEHLKTNPNGEHTYYCRVLGETAAGLHDRLKILKSLQYYWVPVVIISYSRFLINTVIEKIFSLKASIVEALSGYWVEKEATPSTAIEQKQKTASSADALKADKISSSTTAMPIQGHDSSSEPDVTQAESTTNHSIK